MTVGTRERRKFYRLLDSSGSKAAAARGTGITPSTASRWTRPGAREAWELDNPFRSPRLPNESGQHHARRVAQEEEAPLAGPVPLDQLRPEAKRALDDFEFFRRRYLGHVSTPWQVDAAEMVLGYLQNRSRRRHYVCCNEPPGSGKTTLFTHDIPVWLTVRDRSIRGLVGSANVTLAQSYLRRMKDTFTATEPFKPSLSDMELGLAVDAEATLIADYGRFQLPGGRWAAAAIQIERMDRGPSGQKEDSWKAVGLETTYIGGRFNVCVWDDVMDPRTVYSLAQMVDIQRGWDSVAEERLDPGGLLVLPGQRLGPTDIYRYVLDKEVGEGVDMQHGPECCHALPGRKYHHIVYRAHDTDRCVGDHGEDAKPWPDGCLLDPARLPWEQVATKMRDQESYLTTYQQEDADPAEVLVDPLWVNGGTDPQTGEFFQGCWDEGRSIGEVPEGLGPCLSVMTIDPSGKAGLWASEWWLYERASERRYLMDVVSLRMMMSGMLDRDPANNFVGLIEDWFQRSVRLGRRIDHLIVEKNYADMLLRNNTTRMWTEQRSVRLIQHNTLTNRNDKQFGVGALLRAPWRYGKVRLPGAMDGSRGQAMKLVDEATKWRGDGRGYHNDCVMAQWFFEHNLEKMKLANGAVLPAIGGAPGWASGY